MVPFVGMDMDIIRPSEASQDAEKRSIVVRDICLLYFVPLVQYRCRFGHVFNIHASFSLQTCPPPPLLGKNYYSCLSAVVKSITITHTHTLGSNREVIYSIHCVSLKTAMMHHHPTFAPKQQCKSGACKRPTPLPSRETDE